MCETKLRLALGVPGVFLLVVFSLVGYQLLQLVGIDMDKKTGLDRLMVRVGKASHDQLIFKNGSREMDFTGRVMRGFLFIDPDGFDSESDLDFWVEKALEFNSIL